MRRLIGTSLSIALTTLGLAGCGAGDGCDATDGGRLCGTFAQPVASITLAPSADDIAWPPAMDGDRLLVSVGPEVLSVAPSGAVETFRSSPGQTLGLPSVTAEGDVYLAARGLSGVHVDALGTAVWSSNIGGDVSLTPPTVANETVHVATQGDAAMLTSIDRQSGEVLKQREDASPAVVAASGDTVYLRSSSLVTVPGRDEPIRQFAEVIAEAADGTQRWSHIEPEGVVDFAPGGDNEVYIVTGENTLRRIDGDGTVAWTFVPPCDTCSVAAGPTVTSDTVYFPVWETQPEEPDPVWVDPLYALTKDGQLRWIYDGVVTNTKRLDSRKLLSASPAADPASVAVEHIRHPVGRPVITADRRLFVAADGGVVALDDSGREIGRVDYDRSAGETRTTRGWGETDFEYRNMATMPAPVLSEDGRLFVLDGRELRIYDTGTPALDAPWVAPFGGPTNAGRAR